MRLSLIPVKKVYGPSNIPYFYPVDLLYAYRIKTIVVDLLYLRPYTLYNRHALRAAFCRRILFASIGERGKSHL